MRIEDLRRAIQGSVTVEKRSDETVSKINAYLKSQYNKPLDYVPAPSHSPSTLGTPCLRKIYYQYYKVSKDVETDAKGARIFETGKYYEDMVMSWLKAIGEHIPYRLKNGTIPNDRDGKVNPQFPISVPDWRIKRGYIDNIAIVDGELWLYEVKSSGSFKFTALDEPQEDHKVQIGAYYKAFQNHLLKGDFEHIPELKDVRHVSGVKVFYVNKDTTDIKLFTIRTSELDDIVSSIAYKVQNANKYIDLKQLPPKTPDKCSYCPFIKKCKKDWNDL